MNPSELRVKIFQNDLLSPKEKFIAVYLTMHMNDYGDFDRPCLQAIADDCNLSVGSVIRRLRRLRDFDFLACIIDGFDV
jgi:hypothetical protein